MSKDTNLKAKPNSLIGLSVIPSGKDDTDSEEGDDLQKIVSSLDGSQKKAKPSEFPEEPEFFKKIQPIQNSNPPKIDQFNLNLIFLYEKEIEEGQKLIDEIYTEVLGFKKTIGKDSQGKKPKEQPDKAKERTKKENIQQQKEEQKKEEQKKEGVKEQKEEQKHHKLPKFIKIEELPKQQKLEVKSKVNESVLQELIEKDRLDGDKRYRNSYHKNIVCSQCKVKGFNGIRYLCGECFDYNLCENCEKLKIHSHYMFKLKTEFQFRKLVEDIKSKIYGKPEEEVKNSDENLLNQSQIGLPQVREVNKNIDLSKYEIYSDEILKELNAYCKKMMPQSGHTIGQTSNDICLSITVKNVSKIDWPKGFKVKTLNTENDNVESQLISARIKPDEEFQIDLYIKNPKIEGKYSYIFGLVDVKERRFGHEFEFEFQVKSNQQSFFNGLGAFGGALTQSSGLGNLSSGFGNPIGGFGSSAGGFSNPINGFGSSTGGFGNSTGGFGSSTGGFNNSTSGFGSFGGFGNVNNNLQNSQYNQSNPFNYTLTNANNSSGGLFSQLNSDSLFGQNVPLSNSSSMFGGNQNQQHLSQNLNQRSIRDNEDSYGDEGCDNENSYGDEVCPEDEEY